MIFSLIFAVFFTDFRRSPKQRRLIVNDGKKHCFGSNFTHTEVQLQRRNTTVKPQKRKRRVLQSRLSVYIDFLRINALKGAENRAFYFASNHVRPLCASARSRTSILNAFSISSVRSERTSFSSLSGASTISSSCTCMIILALKPRSLRRS